jgi:Domain of unknown function (DUF5703)
VQRTRIMRALTTFGASLTAAGAVLGASAAVSGAASSPSTATAGSAPPLTTAWQGGQFVEDPEAVVSRADIVLGQPNFSDTQSLPLGNGTLGVAAWAQSGFTAQLNRDDTFPNRWSPGQVNIPGLSAMTSATDFTGRLDLTDGVLEESGGGMTLKAWVAANTDQLIVDVTGADPTSTQTASINLWSGRSPVAAAKGAVGTLSETVVDNTQSGNSGKTFGTLAAITAGGRDVSASVSGPEQVTVAFTPRKDGSYRVVVGSPSWTGGNAMATAVRLLGDAASVAEPTLLNAQDQWWDGYWNHTGLIELSSADGTAQYMENLRTIALYAEAASMRGRYAGSHAGVADMFSFDKDQQDWYPSGYWIWNLRTLVATNIADGNPQLNTPLLNMYLNDLPAIEAWTKAQMGGLPGACIPETMRFNGNGFYNGGDNTQNASCAIASSPSYNAETITSGAEVGMWVWNTFLQTGDRTFLNKYFPLLTQTSKFLLAWQKLGPDGLLHGVANAHETQWAVQDPTTDIVAMQTLFGATIKAAQTLGRSNSLTQKLTTALTELGPYARTDAATHSQLLNPDETPAQTLAADAAGTDVISDSYQPTAPLQNDENIGLEPLWPWGAIGDATHSGGDDLTALEDRTYTSRPNVFGNDWSFDAIDAARLDMPSQLESDLVGITEKYQPFISGFGSVFGSTAGDQPYIEQVTGVATALDEALATQYDGTLRIAPAWPSDWNVSGTVYVQDNTKVDVQVQNGTVTTAAIEPGATHEISVRNPWPGSRVEVVDSSGREVVPATRSKLLHFTAKAGHSYLVQQPSAPTSGYAFAPVTGTPPTAAIHLGGQQIGLDPAPHFASLAASFDDAGIVDDTDTGAGNYDGNNATFSEQALTAAGGAPGATIDSSGLDFTFPDVAAGTPDNTVADDQRIDMSGSGSELGFLVSASNGPVTGTGTIVYSDGSTQSYTITAADWFSTDPPSGGAVAVQAAYQDRPGNTMFVHNADIFSVTVPLQPGKTVSSVLLPAVGTLVSGQPALHVFALAIG